jgi:hypothetical protein
MPDIVKMLLMVVWRLIMGELCQKRTSPSRYKQSRFAGEKS